MGSRASRCLGRQNDFDGSIVPDKDPLGGSLTTRIVHGKITKDYDLTPKVLGTGYSGAVKLAVHRESGRQVAVKQFCKRQLKESRIKLLQSEVEVYLRLDHPRICRLLQAYEDRKTVSLVMELCSTELYTRLCKRKVYTEGDAADVMRQMLQAVNYLHSHRIVHRDLKLENWMYGAAGCEDRLKLIDFGFSRVLGHVDELLDMPCGTLHYTSPEVLARKYTSKCDIWSLGVICYTLLIGRPPFRGPNNVKTARAILVGEPPKDGRWKSLSRSAQDFLDCLLTKDATKRPDAAQALAHSWINGSVTSGSVLRGEIGVDVLKSLRQFAHGSHLRRAALTLLAYTMTSHEIEDLEQTFLDFDLSGQGTITLKQLAEVLRDHCKASNRQEMTSQEVRQIFDCLDVAGDEEVQYTPFVAAMLASRVKHHEDKVRAAFEAFDKDRKGFITADSLVKMFKGFPTSSSSTCLPSTETSAASVAVSSVAGAGNCKTWMGFGEVLTREQAERWIKEVDYKENGVIDYEEFLDALMGKRLWPPWWCDDDAPTSRIFEDVDGNRVRGMSESCAFGDPRPDSAWIRYRLASAIIDPDEEPQRMRPQSFPVGILSNDYSVQMKTLPFNVNESYFS